MQVSGSEIIWNECFDDIMKQEIRKRKHLKRKITWDIKRLARLGCIVPYLKSFWCHIFAVAFPRYSLTDQQTQTHTSNHINSQSHCTLMNACKYAHQSSHLVLANFGTWFGSNICPWCCYHLPYARHVIHSQRVSYRILSQYLFHFCCCFIIFLSFITVFECCHHHFAPFVRVYLWSCTPFFQQP